MVTGPLTRKGKFSVRRHLFLPSVRSSQQVLLCLLREHWSIEHEWQWACDH
jgi:hypothetical protein